MAIATKRSAGVKYGKKVTTAEAKKGITLADKKNVSTATSSKTQPSPSTPKDKSKPKSGIPVLTSSAAEKDLNENIKPAFEEAKAGIDEQKSLMDQEQAIANEQKAVEETSTLDNATKQAKLEEIKNKALLIKKELDSMGDEEVSSSETTPTGGVAEETDPYAIFGEAGDKQQELDQVTKAYYKEAERVSKTILDIQNGVVPFTAGEKAQIKGLEQEFRLLMDEQRLINKGATGTASVRGYQIGAGEYDPQFTAKTIGTIASAGVQKIATLNTKMASAVAELEQSFKDNKISAVKDAYAIYKDAAKERTDTLKETIDDIQAEMKAARDAVAKQQEDVDAVTKIVAENGAPAEIIAMVGTSTNPTEAWLAAGQYAMSKRDGESGAYDYAVANGYSGSPLDFHAQWSAAGRKGEAGSGSGGSSVAGYGGDFAATIGLAANTQGSVYGQKAMKDQLEQAIAQGDYVSAYQGILQAAGAGLTAENKTKLQNAAIDQSLLTALGETLQEYKDAGGDMNLAKEVANNAGKSLGVLAADKPYAEIAVQLDSMFQQYRQNMTGAAFGAQESAEYSRVRPKANGSFELNEAVINGAKKYADNYINGAIRATVGQGGIEIKERARMAHSSDDIVQKDKDAQLRVQTYMAQSPENQATAAAIQAAAPNISAEELAAQLGL